MLGVKFIFVGKMKEKHFIAAFDEYMKRLGAFCRAELAEVPETKLTSSPSEAEIKAGLEKEAAEILKQIPSGCYVTAMCIEGGQLSSEEFSAHITGLKNAGVSKICFIVGGSYGIAERVKQRADLRLSMSKMTYPHHLARVMLAEQVYRAFMIEAGSEYHK